MPPKQCDHLLSPNHLFLLQMQTTNRMDPVVVEVEIVMVACQTLTCCRLTHNELGAVVHLLDFYNSWSEGEGRQVVIRKLVPARNSIP